jgi:hypothetical protein
MSDPSAPLQEVKSPHNNNNSSMNPNNPPMESKQQFMSQQEGQPGSNYSLNASIEGTLTLGICERKNTATNVSL